MGWKGCWKGVAALEGLLEGGEGVPALEGGVPSLEGGFQRVFQRGKCGASRAAGGSCTHVKGFHLPFMAATFVYPFVPQATVDIWPSLFLADWTGNEEAEVIPKVSISIKGVVAKPKIVTSDMGWKAMGLAYANPPFSLLAKVLTKIAYEGGRVVMCTPDWGCSGEHAYWRRMLDRMTVGRVQLPDGPIYVPEDSDTAMQAPEWASFLSIVDGSLNPVPLCDLDQVLLKEVMAENRGLTLYDLKNRSPEHLSATLTGCESPDDYLEPAAVKEDADDQLSEIASTIPSVDPSCVDLKHSAFLAQLLLEEVDLESTSETASLVGKPVLHMQPVHTGEPVARSADALARPAANNMPLSEHDTQELRRLLYLKAEGIERPERLQYLRQTWKSSIWSEEDDESYTLPDPEIPLVYSLHYGQQCPPEWDDGTVPAETADRQKKKEHGKSNLHAEEDFLQKLESLNLDTRLKKLLITYEEVFGALPPPLSCKKLVQMDLKLKPEFEKTRVRRRPYPAPQEQVEEIERQIQECIDAGLDEEYKHGDYPHHCSPCFLVAKPGSTALRLVVDYGEVNKKPPEPLREYS